MSIIRCPFTIKHSHSVETVDFKGSNSLTIRPFSAENFIYPGIRLVVTADEKVVGSYILELSGDHPEVGLGLLQKAAELLSFYINLKEINPSYGTGFINLRLGACTIVTGTGHSPLVSISLSAEADRDVPDLDQLAASSDYHELAAFYFEGLQAVNAKSKFVHWFLILERVEWSPRFKRTHNRDESRADRLVRILASLGVVNISLKQSSPPITAAVTHALVKARNAVVHGDGKKWNESVLWQKLFHIVTQVVCYVVTHPGCLDKPEISQTSELPIQCATSRSSGTPGLAR